MLTLGVDEAGRGPAIGPMVMAIVSLDTRGARALTRAGLRDSKSYGAGEAAREARAALAERVRKVALHIAVEVVDADRVDDRVFRGELNVLERELATRMIDGAPPADRIIADGRILFRPLSARYSHLEALDRAEERHAAVAAASVIAKDLRDRLYESICERYTPEFGPIIGGGYVNAGTRRFLCAYAERYRTLLPEARRSWPHPYLSDLIDLPALKSAAAPQLALTV
jgi:ribonuclease HII